ncbi:integral membrane protein [Stemphylium lycopersici]|nr:integral membrane protein [Stemphylium lycopersici]
MKVQKKEVMGNFIQDDSQAPLLLGTCGSLTFLAVGLLCILAVAKLVIVCVACAHGFGRPSTYVSPSSRLSAMRLIFICQVCWYWSIALVKISVALLLIRIKQTRVWHVFLSGTIVLLILTAVTSTFFQFLQCRPFNIYWDPSIFLEGQVDCVPQGAITGNIVAASAVHVSTDLIFSFIPLTFLPKLYRPRGEKILLCILMGLGLVASSFAILRTAGTNMTYATRDIFLATVMPTLWSMLELEVALIAATVPTLKSFMEQALIRIGQWFYDEKTKTHVRQRLAELGLLERDSDELLKKERKPSKPDLDGVGVAFSSPNRQWIGTDHIGIAINGLSVGESETNTRKMHSSKP